MDASKICKTVHVKKNGSIKISYENWKELKKNYESMHCVTGWLSKGPRYPNGARIKGESWLKNVKKNKLTICENLRIYDKVTCQRYDNIVRKYTISTDGNSLHCNIQAKIGKSNKNIYIAQAFSSTLTKNELIMETRGKSFTQNETYDTIEVIVHFNKNGRKRTHFKRDENKPYKKDKKLAHFIYTKC